MIPNGKLVNIFEYASEISKQTESLYINNASCREHLLEFFENNEFFNLPYKKSEKDLMMNFKDVESIAGAIKLWVTAYKKESREKNKNGKSGRGGKEKKREVTARNNKDHKSVKYYIFRLLSG